MPIIAEEYFQAAKERIRQSRVLRSNGEYGASVWVSGVSFEALFRAFWKKTNPVSDLTTGHNLNLLFKQSRFAKHTPQEKAREVGTRVTRLNQIWHNSLRYMPDSSIEQEVRDLNWTFPKKCDYLSYAADRAFNDAHSLFVLGASQWKNL